MQLYVSRDVFTHKNVNNEKNNNKMGSEQFTMLRGLFNKDFWADMYRFGPNTLCSRSDSVVGYLVIIPFWTQPSMQLVKFKISRRSILKS